MNKEQYEKDHIERVRQAILKEGEDSVCEFLALENRILYCSILRLNTGDLCTSPCIAGNDKDRLLVGVTKHNCELLVNGDKN